MVSLRELENAWRQDVSEKLRAFTKEVETELPEWPRERRMEYLKDLLCATKQKLAQWKIMCGRQAMKEKSQSVKAWLIKFADLGPYGKEIEKIMRKMEALEIRRQVKAGAITEAMIQKANGVPLERLVESIRGYITCPYHDDRKPSMLVKNGFGFCFVCNKHMNAIHYMRDVKGLSFANAVKALQ